MEINVLHSNKNVRVEQSKWLYGIMRGRYCLKEKEKLISWKRLSVFLIILIVLPLGYFITNRSVNFVNHGQLHFKL